MLEELGGADELDGATELLLSPFSADSMSEVQENSRPTATTETANPKNLFINDLHTTSTPACL
jgi:hypothetical protein